MRYQVLGPLEAGSESIVALGGPKQRLVLAVLLIRLGGVVSDDRLVDELWPEDAPDTARHAIQTYVSELRRALDDEIARVGSGYRLSANPETVDAHRFETLLAAGRERMHDAPASAATIFREALGLWHGDPYGGVADAPLLRAEVHRLNELRVAAIEDRVAADLEAGGCALVASELEALTREYPFRERLHSLRMLALYRCDRQADALRAYQHARRWLDEELGLDPSPELQELERRILNQDPSLRPAALATSAARGIGAAGGTAGGGATVVRGFELRERVGKDAWGETYRAYQASLGREVAVRLFSGEVQRSADFIRSFDVMARRVASLDHPNVLPLLDWWREAGEACIVTPWMRRGSLEASLGREGWSLAASLRLAEQVGGALSAAHRADLVHGNLTGRNVLLDADGNALVCDFNLVPHEGGGGDGAAEPPSVRADVRSLALLLISALSGRSAEAANPVLALAQVRSDLPADLVAVLAQATSAVSSDRHERIEDLVRDLRQASGADVVAPTRTDEPSQRIRNPYKGLQAFHEADAPDFFGRAELVDRLVQAVTAHGMVVVTGPSGSGKSSLVRAGLLPSLRAHPLPGARDWLVAEMFPGSFPFEELERALLRAGSERPDDLYAELTASQRGLLTVLPRMLPADTGLLLLVDQLEETWSLVDDAGTRQLFLGSLVAAAESSGSPIRIVTTLRADFLDRAMETHAVAEMTRRGLVLVIPPSPEDLAAAVSMPAQQVGLHFDAGLVDRIVRDVDDEPGALPLLQHAMAELVGTRDGTRLTTEAYELIGGVTGALGRRAESVYADLSTDARAVARQVFLRLVAVDEQRDDTRRRVRRTELAALSSRSAVLDEVLRQFGAHRLLTFDRDPVTRGPTVEVAHEALFTEWERLREWIDTRRTELLLHRRVRQASQDWLGADRSPDYLLSGRRLDEAETWTASTDLALSADEQALLDASRERRDREDASRARRRRNTLAGVALVAVMSLALAAVASFQSGRAEVGERAARARALAAAALTQLDRDQDLALQLALDAVQLSTDAGEEPLREAVEALHAATIAHRAVSVVDGDLFVGFTGRDGGVSIGPLQGKAIVWDAVSGQVVDSLETPDADFGDATVSPSGRLVASAFADEKMWVWDVASRDVIARLGRAGPWMGRPAISLSDRLLATFVDGGAGPAVDVYDVGTQASVLEFPVEGARRMAFGANDTWVAVTDDSAPVARLHDLNSGQVIGTVGQPDNPGRLWDMAVDPTGERLALYIEEPNHLEVYDVPRRALIRSIPVGAKPGRVCFLADGVRLAAQGADELLHIWNIASGVEVLTLPGTGFVEGLACSQEGARVAVVSESRATTVYDLDAAATTERAAIAVDDPMAGAWLQDGTMIVADANGLHHLDQDGRLLATSVAAVLARPGWLPISSDGSMVAAATADAGGPGGPIAIFDTASMRPVMTLDGRGRVPVAFSPDGRLLVTGGYGGPSVFDVATGSLLRDLELPDGRPVGAASAAFLPDGVHVALKPASAFEAWVFDVRSGSYVGTVCAAKAGLHVGVDPHGDVLVIADHADFIEQWSLDGLLDAIAGDDPGCTPAGPNASDGARVLANAAPSEGGFAFSADGQWLASTNGLPGTVAISDRRTGNRVLEISHRGETEILGFSPDGRWLAVAFNDQRGAQDAVRIYAVHLDDLLEVARAKVVRPLTDADCEAYPDLLGCSQR